jgi:uncharacterized membrane protein
MNTKSKINRLFVFVVAIICIVLALLPTGFENPLLEKSSLREKAKVIEVNNEDLQNHSVVTVGTQDLKLKILSGTFKGDTVHASNVLMGQKKIDKIFYPNERVLAVLKLDTSGTKILSARADDRYRINLELILFFLFALFLVGFAGWTGLKALISFVFTALIMWKALIPFLLKGFSPVPLSLVVVSLTTTVIILLVSGFTRKGLVALSGSVVGILLTTLLAYLFGYFFKVPGTVQEFSEALLYIGYTHLRISDIFLAAIFVSAAGAVMDVAMDIAASQNELIEKKPEMRTWELIKSGFSIAYPVIGTMTTTLLFAYSGSFIFVFMVFMAKGTPVISIFNTNYIAAEILHTLVGSFGLVLVAPTTAIIGGYIFSKKHQKFNKS